MIDITTISGEIGLVNVLSNVELDIKAFHNTAIHRLPTGHFRTQLK